MCGVCKNTSGLFPDPWIVQDLDGGKIGLDDSLNISSCLLCYELILFCGLAKLHSDGQAQDKLNDGNIEDDQQQEV